MTTSDKPNGREDGCEFAGRFARQRGMTMPAALIFLFAFLAIAFLALDVAQQTYVANEVQIAATVAASAAARAVMDNSDGRGAAVAVLGENRVYGQSADGTLVKLEFERYSVATNTLRPA